MPYTLAVDKTLCMSAGKCVADYPSAFAFDPEDLAEMLPGADELSDAERLAAARGCPQDAIRVRDEAGAEVDPYG